MALLMAVVVVGTLVGSGRPGAVLAAPCGGVLCLQVDTIPGGSADNFAFVGSTFAVDILSRNYSSDNVGTFRFVLQYDATLLQASAPSTAGHATAVFACAGATGDLAEAHPDADGNPATGEAYIYCDGGGLNVFDTVLASITFTSLSAGVSNLDLKRVQVGDFAGIENMSCLPVITYAGLCGSSSVDFVGPVVLPPPAISPCSVQFAVHGSLLQCLDGRRVRLIGVDNPLPGDPGGDWSTTVTNWFLAGKTVTLETDTQLLDGTDYLAYPHVTGTDGNDYNMSALLIYVGMARYAAHPVNLTHDGWFGAAQNYARSQCWNMWANGNPWAWDSGC
jgi:hypothetical protein